MHDFRVYFACAAAAECIIVAGTPEGFLNTNQPRSTTMCFVSGCGFRVICLTMVDCMRWAARFCRRSRGAYASLCLTRGSAGATQPLEAGHAVTSCPWWRNVSVLSIANEI